MMLGGMLGTMLGNKVAGLSEGDGVGTVEGLGVGPVGLPEGRAVGLGVLPVQS